MGQVGGTSSVEAGLQRVFFFYSYLICEQISSCVTAVCFTFVGLNSLTGKVEEDSHGTHLIRGEKFYNNILNVDDQCLSKNS